MEVKYLFLQRRVSPIYYTDDDGISMIERVGPEFGWDGDEKVKVGKLM